jgi:restriction system protein
MPIPDYQTVMRPFLTVLSDGKTYFLRDITKLLASHFNVIDEELEQTIPSEGSTIGAD